MKKTIKGSIICILMFLSCALQSGMLPDSGITINQTNASLETVIGEVERQSGCNFEYDVRLLKNKRKVSVNLRNVPLKKALKECLKDQPIAYTIEQKNVFLQPKERAGEWMLSPVVLWILYRIDRSIKITKTARKWRRKVERKIRKRMKKWLKDRFKE